MAACVLNILASNSILHKYSVLSQLTCGVFISVRGRKIMPRPRYRPPAWHMKKEHAQYDESLTQENASFIKEFIQDKYGSPTVIDDLVSYSSSPLINEPMERGQWTPLTKRTGLIARKLGVYPLWLKDGEKVLTTLLQIVDNHVVRYIPPGEFDPPRKPTKKVFHPERYGCLLVGAEAGDPSKFTKEYCGLFSENGVIPKNILKRFIISPEAAIQPGTPLYASHFQPGDFIDVLGLTVDRGFQGVMKRWGFKGGPASHGCTKSHRRPGCIGTQGMARVWPGKKMPGHMGNRWRILKGQQILRINTKYNVIWVKGAAVAGSVGSVCYLYDTILPLRKKKPEYFPTFYPEDLDEPLPEEIYEEHVHPFSAPTITFDDKK